MKTRLPAVATLALLCTAPGLALADDYPPRRVRVTHHRAPPPPPPAHGHGPVVVHRPPVVVHRPPVVVHRPAPVVVHRPAPVVVHQPDHYHRPQRVIVRRQTPTVYVQPAPRPTVIYQQTQPVYIHQPAPPPVVIHRSGPPVVNYVASPHVVNPYTPGIHAHRHDCDHDDFDSGDPGRELRRRLDYQRDRILRHQRDRRIDWGEAERLLEENRQLQQLLHDQLLYDGYLSADEFYYIDDLLDAASERLVEAKRRYRHW